MHTKIPPFGGGGGAESSNLGFVELSTGNIQPESENVSENPQPLTATPSAVVEEQNYTTQQTEESAVVEAKKEKIPEKKVIKTIEAPVKTEVLFRREHQTPAAVIREHVMVIPMHYIKVKVQAKVEAVVVEERVMVPVPEKVVAPVRVFLMI